jgi:hypothetical protein
MVDKVTGLGYGRFGVHIPVVERGFSLSENARNCSGSHTTSHSTGTEVLSRRYSGRRTS